MRTLWSLRTLGTFALALGTAAFGQGLKPVSNTTLSRVQRSAPQLATKATSQLRTLRTPLKLSTQDDFRVLRTSTDRFGETHVRVQQTYQGVPVWGGAAVVHLDANGKTVDVTDSLVRGVSVPTAPKLSADQAVNAARALLQPKGEWAVKPTSELFVYPIRKDVLPPNKDPKTVNAVEVRHVVTGYALVYHVHTELANPTDGVKQTDFLIDATTGKALRSWNSLQTAGAVVGTGNSQYSGVVSLDTFDDGAGSFYLIDSTRGTDAPHPVTGDLGITIRNADHTGNYGTLYTDADNTWGDGADYDVADPANTTDSDNGQTAGVDALYGLEQTWDYYAQVHGRNGIDDQGTAAVGVVHYSTDYDNASWSDSCFCMVFGDGSKNPVTGLKTVTALDVVGHELSHGVTSRTAGLIYEGESGGLNESSSDINGTMVEFFARDNGDLEGPNGNWLLGEGVQENGQPLRYMYKPSLDGLSYDAWFPGIGDSDVHFSSGPMNRAFFFLSQGASSDSTSDYYSSYLPGGMSGIGSNEAAAIWYRALTQYLLPWSDYVSARVAALRSAKDLFGSLSPEYAAVENAFAAINVGYSAGAFDDVYPPTVTLSASESGAFWILTANTTDNVGISGVDFYLDGTYLTTVFSAPFELQLPAFDLPNGAHDVLVFATDTANNYAFDEQSITLTAGYDGSMANGGFEAGEDGSWTYADTYGGVGSPLFSLPGFGIAHGGDWFAWMNDYGVAGTQTLSQVVTVPNDPSVVLDFWLSVDTTEFDGLQHGTFVITADDGSGPVQIGTTIDNLTDTGGFASYAHYQIDLAPFAGKTVTLTFTGTEDGVTGEYTGFLLDDVSVRGFSAADADAPLITAQEAGLVGPLTFTATVQDRSPITSVEFWVDGSLVGSALTAAPWATTVDSSTLTNGSHSLVVKATDSVGNVGSSAAVDFFVDNTMQEVVQNPSFEDGSYDANSNWLATNWTETSTNTFGYLPGYDDGGLSHSGMGYMWLGGWTSAVTDTVSQTITLPASPQSAILSFYYLSATPASDGTAHDIFHVQVRDAAGTTVISELATLSNLDSDSQWHQRTFDMASFAGQTVTVYFEMDSDDDGVNTNFFLDDVTLNVSQADPPPVVSASVVGDGGLITLSGVASDDGVVTSVVFKIDTAVVATIANPSPQFATSFDSALLPDGVHTLVIEATDNVGLVGTSAPVTFATSNVLAGDSTAPQISLLWSEHACAEADLEIQSSDDFVLKEVELYADGQFLTTFAEPPTLHLQVPTASFGPGPHTIIANAIDARGHHMTASVDFVQSDILINPSYALVLAGAGQAYAGQSCTLQPSTVSWSVQESGGGAIDASGQYVAPMTQGTFHVVATSNADGSTNTATVRVYNPDVDGDASTDGVDMGQLAAAWGSASGDANYSAAADLDGNGAVDDADLNLFLPQFGK